MVWLVMYMEIEDVAGHMLEDWSQDVDYTCTHEGAIERNNEGFMPRHRTLKVQSLSCHHCILADMPSPARSSGCHSCSP